MEKYTIIRDIALILAISLPILYFFRKIKVSPVIGFLVTGIIIGPAGMKWVTTNDQIEVMAEIGVIMLMFTIGLEFSLKRLLAMKHYFFLFGSLQVALTITAVFALLSAFGIPWRQSLFLGMLLSLSSTAIVLKMFGDYGVLDAPSGKITTAILLFQDISLIPMLIILPLLQAGAELSPFAVVSKTGTIVLVLGGIVLLSRFVVPRLLFQVSQLRVREVFTATMIVLLLGTAYITHSLGISFSIGAFIAGFIIADSEYSHQIISEALPFKDIFNSLFFVSVGLLLSPSEMSFSFPAIIAIAVGVILLKGVIVYFVIHLNGFKGRTAAIAGMSLAQVGEFSFVAAGAGLALGIINPATNSLILAVVVITMTAAPFLIDRAMAIRAREKKKEKGSEEKTRLRQHVIIAGFGLNGRNLAKVLKETGIQYCIIELNPRTVRAMKKSGEEIVYGDIVKREVLKKAGIGEAKVIVFAVSDPQSTRMAAKLAKQMNPSVHTIVRTRYVKETGELLAAGADTVIPEEFETSLQIFSKVLSQYHVPMNVILRQMNLIRQDSYELLRSSTMTLTPEYLMDVITKSVTETMFIEEGSAAIGKTLRELDLRAKTDATVLAIVRSETAISPVTGAETLQYGDIIVLTGTHIAVDAAMELLRGAL